MSEVVLRVAAVAEGPTDFIVIAAILRSALGANPFTVIPLQPESSAAFGSFGGGWGGVYKWCKTSASRGGGRISDDPFLKEFDLVIVHLDADVANATYDEANIARETADGVLPCSVECPPASDTVDRLRNVLLSWCGEPAIPNGVVFCTPSKSTEAWMIAAFFPGDIAVQQGIECHPDPESRLGQQPKAVRFKKKQAAYRDRELGFAERWPALTGLLSQAARFNQELSAALVRAP